MAYQRLDESLIKEWNWEKNVGLDPNKLNVKAKTKLWWICANGHQWSARLDHRKRGSGCPYDSGQRLLSSNSLANTFPEIAKQWHPHKNELTPYDVSRATTKVYWWLCEKDHKWRASVANRTRRGDNCPYCSGKIATPETCLQTRNPILAKQWNYDKNGSLTPLDVTLMSNKCVWWICDKGHSWQDKIVARASSGNRCKICFPRKPQQMVSSDYNLKAINPKLVDEWHPTKNKGLDPATISPGSGKSAWWQCRFCRHTWQAKIDNRNGKNRGCPKCNAGNSSSFHEQCIFFYLSKVFPDCENRYLLSIDSKSIEIDIFIPSLNIAIEYDGYFYHKNRAKQDERKNNELQKQGIKLIRIRENNNPDKMLPLIKKFSSIELQCKADDEKELTNVIKKILIFLEIHILLEGIVMKHSIKDTEISIKKDYLEILNNAKKNEKERSLAFLYPVIAKEWHKEKNQQLSPWNFTPGSNERVWWTCNTCSRDWNAIINRRVNGQTCPYCSGYKAGPVRSLEKERPQTAVMWHLTKNGDLTPKDVLPGSNKMAWWFCSTCNQEWEEPISRRSSKKGCPYCNGKRVYEGNCLATIKPEIAKLWHPTKNGNLTPFDVTSCSGKVVWWKCGCGKDFEKKVSNMKEGCIKCIR